MSVTLTPHGLDVAGKAVPVYSGSVHYWRLERGLWPKILDRVAELGFEMIETYIPWSVHEIRPGVYDWGQIDDRKDVEAFMQLCEERGLWLMVRPGPLINAELTDFGFPKWVLLDPKVQARTAVNSLHLDAAWGLHPPRPFPVPSYASEEFFAASGGWFDAICPIMARHLAPDGCIVAVQSDNETAYLFHDQPYATDYSDASLTLYRTFLAERYTTIADLNAAYGSDITGFSAVEPPRDCYIEERADLPWHLDWIQYKEFQIRWSVARFARMLRERGVDGIPIFHDVAYQETTPHDVARMETDPDIDWVGMNCYCNKEQYNTVATRSRFLTGTTILPFVPEFGCGLWSHHQKTFMPAEHEFITLSALMNGLRAINFYMLVERERWQGCPITRHGEFRPDYMPFYAELGSFLKKYPVWEFERDRTTLVLLNYDIGRHVAALSTLNLGHADLLGFPEQLFEVEVDLGLRGDPRREAELTTPGSWLERVSRELSDRSVDFDLGDTHVDLSRLQPYSLVAAPSVDFMDAEDQRTLLRYVEGGGRLVIGPELPTLDPALKPLRILADLLDVPGRRQVGKGELIWAKNEDLDAVIEEFVPQAEFRLNETRLRISVHRRGEQTLVFVANPTSESIDSSIAFDGRKSWTTVWGDSYEGSADGEMPIGIPPYSIRIYSVTTDSPAGGIA